MKFVLGRSYLYIFAIYMLAFVVALVAAAMMIESINVIGWVALSMPAMIFFILVSELRSGIALDRWWTARHVHGCKMFPVLIAWHAFGLVALSVQATAIFLF